MQQALAVKETPGQLDILIGCWIMKCFIELAQQCVQPRGGHWRGTLLVMSSSFALGSQAFAFWI